MCLFVCMSVCVLQLLAALVVSHFFACAALQALFCNIYILDLVRASCFLAKKENEFHVCSECVFFLVFIRVGSPSGSRGGGPPTRQW